MCGVNFDLNRVVTEMKPPLCRWTGALGVILCLFSLAIVEVGGRG